MKSKPQYPYFDSKISESSKLKNCKVENYKIDYDLKILYKVLTSYHDNVPNILKSLPLDHLDDTSHDYIFGLMKKYQCDNFTIYYENDYDIVKIVNLVCHQDLILTEQQILFLKNFFIKIKKILINLFDKHIKPVINETNNNNTNMSGNNINNVYHSKNRILN